MKNKLDEINKVVAVMAYGRAASGLWSSLLDGHPNILTTPDCFIMDFSDFWKKNQSLPLENLINAFIEKYEPIFDPKKKCKCHGDYRNCGDYLGWTRMGKNKDKSIHVNKDKFRSTMIELLKEHQPVSRRDFFAALHYSYTLCTKKQIDKPMIISFGLHICKPKCAEELLSDFPETLFLQTIRQPVDGLTSWLRHYQLDRGLAFNNVFSLLQMAFDGGKPLTKVKQYQWRAIKFEDIHTNPEETIDKVRKWLDIPWNDSLLKSTWNGMKWWNEKNSKNISGFNKSMVQQDNYDVMPKFDKFRYTMLMIPKCNVWKYSLPKSYYKLWLKLLVLPLLIIPFKAELLSLKRPEIKGNIFRKIIFFPVKAFAAYGMCRLVLLCQWWKMMLNKQEEVELL